MTWTPYAAAVAATLAVAVIATEIADRLRRRILTRIQRLERDLDLIALGGARTTAKRAMPQRRPYSWSSDRDLFVWLTLDEIRRLPETREPAR